MGEVYRGRIPRANSATVSSARLFPGSTLDRRTSPLRPDASRLYPAFIASSTPSLGEGKWQVSRDGAWGQSAASSQATLKWRNDVKELPFMGANNAMMAVVVNMSVLPGGAGETPITGSLTGRRI
jgi:hypothetical protein